MSKILSKNIDIVQSQFEETRVLVDLWNTLRRDGDLLPRWLDFEFLDLPIKIIPHLVIVDILHDPSDFYYRFWGSWHVDYHGYDLTAKRVSDLVPAEYRDMISDQYQQISKATGPELYTQKVPLNSGLLVQTELLRLPMSDIGKTVSKIISVEMARDVIHDVHQYFDEYGSA